jgi:hypothetical protein
MATPRPLKAKQAIDYIRYLSTDGKTSYYQNKNGELLYASFYNTKTIMKKEALSQFYVTVKNEQVLIEHVPNYYNLSVHEKNHEIYYSKPGEAPTLIGKGISPKIHPKVSRITYIDLLSSQMIIYDYSFKKIVKKIALKAANLGIKDIDILFMGKNDFIFSDYNSKNQKAFFYYSLIDGTKKIIFKSSSSQYTLNSCLVDKNLIVGQFPINNLALGTEIISISLYNNKNFSDYKQIYSSSLPDLGNMICSGDSVFFLKSFNKNLELQSREVDAVRLSIETKALKRISELKSLTSLLKMDKLILTQHKGKFLILDGTQILDDKLEKANK